MNSLILVTPIAFFQSDHFLDIYTKVSLKTWRSSYENLFLIVTVSFIWISVRKTFINYQISAELTESVLFSRRFTERVFSIFRRTNEFTFQMIVKIDLLKIPNPRSRETSRSQTSFRRRPNIPKINNRNYQEISWIYIYSKVNI